MATKQCPVGYNCQNKSIAPEGRYDKPSPPSVWHGPKFAVGHGARFAVVDSHCTGPRMGKAHVGIRIGRQ